jgi:hypothetical protein
MDRTPHLAGQIYSYLALRNTVGWIGILLPFVLMGGSYFIFGEEIPLFDISMYYYSGMRDVFVGAMCAVGLFLFFYRGYNRWDNLAGDVAGFCALLIAWFPTSKMGPQDWAGQIHFGAAGVFFGVLAIFSLFLFTRTGDAPTRRKIQRNLIYITCGIILLVASLGMLIYFLFLQKRFPHTRFVFWAETTALVAFGISWLTKGGTLLPDKKCSEAELTINNEQLAINKLNF